MVKRQAVFVAEVLITVFAVEREIRAFPAESAGFVQRVLFLFKKTGKKSPDAAQNSHVK
jgi:hypothetical protein